nr:MAG TPA: hypothetical protein [Caudoviricetes sp.]
MPPFHTSNRIFYRYKLDTNSIIHYLLLQGGTCRVGCGPRVARPARYSAIARLCKAVQKTPYKSTRLQRLQRLALHSYVMRGAVLFV